MPHLMTPIEQIKIIGHNVGMYKEGLLDMDLSRMPHDVSCVLTHINKRLFEESLNVNSALEHCGVKSHSFNGRFRLEMMKVGFEQCTIHKYIHHHRIEASKMLLHIPGLDLLLIASSLGFRHYETFIRAFRRSNGVCPSRYRDTQTDGGVNRQAFLRGQNIRSVFKAD